MLLTKRNNLIEKREIKKMVTLSLQKQSEILTRTEGISYSILPFLVEKWINYYE